MVSYGKALGVVLNETVLNYLHHFTCEWMECPAYPMSKMSQSLLTNLPLLHFHENCVFVQSIVNYLHAKIEPILESLRKLNS